MTSEPTVVNCNSEKEVVYCPAGKHIINIGDASEGCLCPDCEHELVGEGFD